MRVAEMAEFLDATNPEHMMSQTVTCDACGKTGQRKLSYPCPDGWFYMETRMEGEAEPDFCITYACSEECTKSPWRKGPGPRFVIGAAFQKQPSDTLIVTATHPDRTDIKFFEDGSRQFPYQTMPEPSTEARGKWCKCCACWLVTQCSPLNDFHTRPTHGKLLFCLTCVMTKSEPRT